MISQKCANFAAADLTLEKVSLVLSALGDAWNQLTKNVGTGSSRRKTRLEALRFLHLLGMYSCRHSALKPVYAGKTGRFWYAVSFVSH